MPEPLLMVGNFLSGRLHTRGMGEELCLRLQPRGWSVITTSSYPNRFQRLADMLGTVLFRAREYRLALVEVYSGPAFIWTEAVCDLLDRLHKPYMLVLHGGGLPAFGRRQPGRVKQLLAGARAVTVPSRFLLEEMGTYRQDLLLIPNAIDLSHYQFRPRISPAPNLIWLRAFHEIYNPCLAIEVLRQVQHTFPAARLIMVGPDKGDGSLQRTQQRAEELELADAVEFPGGISKAEVPAWLNRGDIFINTTHVDNTPVSVIEALACGMCVVSTNVGGLPYLLEDGKDALLVPPDDPAAMAAAIQRILDEPDLAEKLSCNARRKVEQFDWTKILPQWEALLDGVLNHA